VWRVILNEVPTMANLRLIGVSLNSVTCIMCDEQGETINHLLFTYKVVAKICNICYIYTRKLGVNHNQIQAHFEHFNILKPNHNGICYVDCYSVDPMEP